MRNFIFLFVLLVLIFRPGAATATPLMQASDGEVYIVQADDWLSKLADKFYGDMFTYPTIVDATNARAAQDDSFAMIDNPDLIEVGQKLWIPAQAAPAMASATANSSLTLDVLRNSTYQGIYQEPVQLTDGSYEGEPFVEGGAARPTITFVDAATAFGDLNGDGVEDAAVILAENSGGSGVFIYLAAVINQDDLSVNVATQFLGDRVNIKTLTITEGQVVIDMVTQGPDDPFCCPTLEVSLIYRLEGEQLVELLDFVGTYKATLPAASSPGREITLNLNVDNTAELTTDYLNGEPPVVETGTWQDNGNRTTTIILSGRPDGQVYADPLVITFELAFGQLTAVAYDQSLYGSAGLQLIKQ